MIAPFYRAFEDRHRGSRDLIKERQRVYLPFILPLKELYPDCPTLDLGCGRGEWLELLIENGCAAKGVDLDQGMLEACVALNLPAEHGDAISALQAMEDDSLAVISGFHIAEHIPFTALQILAAEAIRVLKPAGLLVLETPNAENLMVGANNFYLDPTHERPIPHLLLSFLTEHSGFVRSKLLRLNEPQDFENVENVQIINVLSAASPDYAIVAQKDAPAEMLALSAPAFEKHYGMALDRLADLYEHGLQRRFEQTAMQASIQAAQLSGDVAAQFEQVHLAAQANDAQVREIKSQAEAASAAIEWMSEKLNDTSTQLDQVHSQSTSNLAQLEQSHIQSRAQFMNLDLRTINLESMVDQIRHKLEQREDQASALYAAEHGMGELAKQLQQVQQALSDSQANAHHWYMSHEDMRVRLDEVYGSTSWKVTAPLRLTMRLLKSGVRSPGTIAKRVRNAMRKAEPQQVSAPGQRQLFVDISELIQRDAKTGIQRVVRAILGELLSNPPTGYDVCPVYGTSDGLEYQYVQVTQTHDGLEFEKGLHAPIHFHSGDMFLGLDLQHQVVVSHAHEYEKMRAAGVKVYFVIYDLLPIFLPDSFWQGASHMHADWLTVIAQNDGAMCISKAVADEYYHWLTTRRLMPQGKFRLGWFHLGADLESSAPSRGLAENAPAILKNIESRPTFLVVGTVEPRKGHAQVLESFTLLWAEGVDVNLVFVGKQGWNVEPLVEAIVEHPEFGHRLIWADAASDEYLEAVYKRSSCLVAASLGEGFGLPLIEAAQHGIPIIARDLPVFQEVAGEHAMYFSGDNSEALASAVTKWLALNEQDKAPCSTNIPWLTWEQSAGQLKTTLFDDQWYWKTPAAENDAQPYAKTK